ncbi:MAG: YHS domain-containing protein [Candidatus Aminicenantales bacterium]
MSKQSKIFALVLAVSFLFVLSGIAQQAAEDTVICPVNGKVMKTSEAKATFEYQGKTYYFCCEKCKEEFVKNPEKYLQKKAEKKEVYTCSMHPEEKSETPGKCPKCGMNMEKKAMSKGCLQEQMMKEGGKACCDMKSCPMMMKDVEKKIENIATGVVITLTSKNPETAKKIQEHAAKMKEGCAKMKKTGSGEEQKK